MLNLEELKLEVLRRAQSTQTPFRLPFKMDDIKLFINRLRSTDRDDWAAAWCHIAEPYEKRGDELLNEGKKKEALESYKSFLKLAPKAMMANVVLERISHLED